MEEGIGSVTDSEQIFLCHDSEKNIVGQYFKKLEGKINSYEDFLKETVQKNPFLSVVDLNFKPVHFGIHLYTTNEMCRFCGDSLVAKLKILRQKYRIPLNIFVSYGKDISPGSEEKRPAGFSHLINQPHLHYKIINIPCIDDEKLRAEIVFQKKMTSN